jgi:hypothetical protein
MADGSQDVQIANLGGALKSLRNSGSRLASCWRSLHSRPDWPSEDEFRVALSSDPVNGDDHSAPWPIVDPVSWPVLLSEALDALRHWWAAADHASQALGILPKDLTDDIREPTVKRWSTRLFGVIDTLCRSAPPWPAAAGEADEHYLEDLVRWHLPSSWNEDLERLVEFEHDLACIQATRHGAGRSPGDKAVPQPQYLFRDKGDLFEIHFGTEHNFVTGLDGGRDYLRLLRLPGKEIGCAEMTGAVKTAESSASAQSHSEAEVRGLREQVKGLKKEHDNTLNPDRATELMEQINSIELNIQKKLEKEGRARAPETPGRSALVQRCIHFRKACKKKNLTHFVGFLEDNVNIGTSCIYNPPEKDAPEWEF